MVDTDWGTNGNWVSGIIPNSSIDAKIINVSPNYPEVDEAANCYNLVVAENKSLTINTGANLLAGGDFWGDGTFIMNNGTFAITGDLNNSVTSLVDINGGMLSMNGWYESGVSTWALGTIELSGGIINVATNVLMNNVDANSLMNGPFDLNIGGSLEFESSSFSAITNGTITMQGSGSVLPVLLNGTFKVNNLIIDATGTYIFSRNACNNYYSIINNFNIVNGNVQFLSDNGTGKPENFFVGNDMSISNGTTVDVDVNNAITLRGNFANNGTFNHNTGLFVFDGSTTISGSSTTSFASVTLNIDKDLAGPASGILNIGGDFINNGTYNHNSGTLLFNGNTQTIAGTSQTLFNNLTIDVGSITTMSSAGLTLFGVLKSDGTLNTGGNLTLLSSSSQTALIDGSGTGSVLGNITMQRYLSSRFGYRYISSPYTSATANEFSSYVDFGTGFPPLFRYDEDRVSAGWVNYSNAANPLVPLFGYALNFGSNSTTLTFNMTGVANNGSITSLSLYNHNHTYTAGFNLVGNPYPSPIDWDAASGWTKTNIDNAVYYFNPGASDQYGGTYSSYINGISSDGFANGIIPSMQGFFVHISDGSYPVTGILGTNNSVRVNNLSPVYHKESITILDPLLRISAGYTDGMSPFDPLVICLNEEASTSFEKDRDALKIMNSDYDVPSLYTISSDQRNLSISSIPDLTDSISIVPLGIKTKKDDWISFYADKIEMFPNDMQIYLRDGVTGIYHDLLMDPEYKIYISTGEYNDRFSVVFSQKDLLFKPSKGECFYAYNFGNTIFVYINTQLDSKTNVFLINISGQEIIDLTPSMIYLNKPATIKIIGKGNKARLVPMLDAQTMHLKNYLKEYQLNGSVAKLHPLFTNSRKEKLTRSGINYIFQKYVKTARKLDQTVIPARVSCHSLRHSKAMHLLQAGVNLVYIRDILGHVSIQTTEIYARADSKYKRIALEKAYVDVNPDEEPTWVNNENLISWLKKF